MIAGESEFDLQRHVRDLLEIELQVEEMIDRIFQNAQRHPDTASALTRSLAQAKGHREALQSRLRSLGGGVSGFPRVSAVQVPRENPQSASETLGTIQGLLGRAVLGYSVLHAVAHRFFDSKVEGNTADLAEKHLRDYAEAMHAVNRAISDAAVWDLGKVGQTCQCQCPSCGLGLCLCSPHGTNTVSDIWRETASAVPPQAAGGLRVRLPREDSAAHRAGLREGDIIVAVEGRYIRDDSSDSISEIQNAIRAHQAGEDVRLRVRRTSGDLEEIAVTRQPR